MPAVELTTRINAPIERCFDLYRSIDLHVDSYQHSNEKVVGPVNSGLASPGEVIDFRMRSLGFSYRLAVSIVRYEPPHYFRDSQVEGFLLRADHDHRFTADGPTTVVTDVFDYTARYGPLGTVLSHLMFNHYIRWTISRKNANVKRVAESEEWQRYLQPSS